MEKKDNKDELVQKFINEIKTDGKFERFFKDYSPSSVESFVKVYSHKKAMWTLYGPSFKEILENLETQWVSEAKQRLEEIQQVKLFLYQCEFRAGNIEKGPEGIKTIFDFFYWKENILNATFLEPISEEDVAIYSDYLMSDEVNHNPFPFIEDWQDFDQIKQAYNDPESTGRTVPDWYTFYFSRTGRGTELTFPDIRKEKDIFYFQAGNNERIRLAQEERAKELLEKPGLAKEKGLYFNEFENNNLTRFMNLFEDKDNLEMHKVWNAWCTYNEKEELLRDDLDILMYAKEDVPVEFNVNWIEGIQIAASRYRSLKIAESLPAAYQQYKMNLDLNIHFPEKDNSREQSDFYNNLVLLGRKLNGQPEDFEY